MMRKNLFLLCCCLNLLVIKGMCQTDLSGTVNTKDNIQLPFATVTLYADSNALQHVICDSNGRFTIRTPKSIQDYNAGSLRLRAFYKQLTSEWFVITRQQEPIRLIINDPVKVLTSVVVEADAARINRQGDRFIFVPSKGLAKGSDAFDMLRHVPLIRVEDQSDAFSIINKSSTIIYVNNKKSDIPREMVVQLLRAMPAENIISIEVITNPGSEYASNITGGIININLRRAFRDGWQGNISALTEQSQYNTSILNGGLTYRKGKFAVNFIPFINNSFNYYRLTNDVTDKQNNLTRFNTEYKRKYTVMGGGVNVDYQASARSYIGFKYWQTNVWGRPRLSTTTQEVQAGDPDSFTNSVYKGRDSYLYNFGNVNYHYNFDSLGRTYVDINIDFNRFRQNRTLEGRFDQVDENEQIISPLGQYRNVLPQRFWNLSEQVDFKKTLAQLPVFYLACSLAIPK